FPVLRERLRLCGHRVGALLGRPRDGPALHRSARHRSALHGFALHGPALRGHALDASALAEAAQEVPHLRALRLQVAAVVSRGRDLDRLAPRDLEAVPFEPHDLARIVREDPDRAQPQVEEDLSADPEVAQIRLEAEGLVRLHRVLALVLERVRADLVREADPAALLLQVDDGAFPLLLDPTHRGVELLAAIAAKR